MSLKHRACCVRVVCLCEFVDLAVVACESPCELAYKGLQRVATVSFFTEIEQFC